MVIAVASLCLVVDEDRRGVRVALGSVGPTILRARAAELEIARALESAGVWDDPAADLPREAIERFQSAVAAAARPIDDVRGSATYRRHACGVLAHSLKSMSLNIGAIKVAKISAGLELMARSVGRTGVGERDREMRIRAESARERQCLEQTAQVRASRRHPGQ